MASKTLSKYLGNPISLPKALKNVPGFAAKTVGLLGGQSLGCDFGCLKARNKTLNNLII